RPRLTSPLRLAFLPWDRPRDAGPGRGVRPRAGRRRRPDVGLRTLGVARPVERREPDGAYTFEPDAAATVAGGRCEGAGDRWDTAHKDHHQEGPLKVSRI